MKQYNIWGSSVPYNSTRLKEKDLIGFRENATIEDLFSKNGDEKEDKDVMDMSIIKGLIMNDLKNGTMIQTYDDMPYIEAHLVRGSKKSVLLVPGGAYCHVAMQNEGTQIAECLNERGISAFALKYRTYPYKYPVPFLDCQRAIRYIIYNKDKFDIDPDQLSLLGFSAGGNLVATTTNLFLENNEFPIEYQEDDIDKTLIKIHSLGLVYPKLEFTDGAALLTPLFGAETIRNIEQRNILVEKFTQSTKVTKNHPPTFLCNAVDDSTISNYDLLTYAASLDKNNVSFELHMFKKGGHAFGACKKKNPQEPDLLNETKVWINLYCNWLIEFKY